MNSCHCTKGLKSGRGPKRVKTSSVTRESIIKIANGNSGGWRGPEGGTEECKDQGTFSEASDRNDSRGCSGEKNPSGNRVKEMKQEFAALFKAFGRRGTLRREEVEGEENGIALPKGIKGIIRAF